MENDALPRCTEGSLTATIFGVFAGVGGFTHAVGEILQGNVAADGLFFESWTCGPIAENLGGEPTLSIIPNVFVSGIVTLIVSITIVVWAAAFARRKLGGFVLILLSVSLLLFGGGVGPPTVGIIAGFGGRRHGLQPCRGKRLIRGVLRRVLAQLWPWVFAAALANGVFLFLGSLVLACIFDVSRPQLFVNSFLFEIVLLLITNLTSIARRPCDNS